MSGLVFDAGALVAFEKKDRTVAALVKGVLALRGKLVIPAGVVGQVWRDGARQVQLARLLASPAVIVEPLDDRRARAAGQLCGVTGTRDLIDAAVVLSAREHRLPIVTSDAGDLRRLDSRVRLIAV